MNKKMILLLSLVFLVVIALALVFFLRPGADSGKDIVSEKEDIMSAEEPVGEKETGESVKLVYAVHWIDDLQTEGIYEDGVLKEKGLKRYLEEYTSLHPEVEFEVLVIPYDDYEARLRLLDGVGEAPDIFQAYSPWGAGYVERGMIDQPPLDIKNDVLENYISSAGATVNEEIWGIPSEINDFALIYNKRIFKEAGIVDANGEAKAPKTWADLLDAAQKTTKKDGDGNITRYGIAFLKGTDWGVVNPFLSLLFSNGGSYLNEDNTQAMFNSPEGVEVLTGITSLFDNAYTDANSNVWDFSKGEAAMAFVAPWMEGIFKEAMGNKVFDEEAGVAPIPYFEKPGSLQYSWFLGVMDKSKNKEAAWDFLRWFTTDIQKDRGTTRYGDLLARTIKAVPSRLVDMENNYDMLEGNSFKAPFIAQLSISTSEPNIPEAAEIKGVLQEEIEAAWIGKDPKQALDDAADKVNLILSK